MWGIVMTLHVIKKNSIFSETNGPNLTEMLIEWSSVLLVILVSDCCLTSTQQKIV
jgi:hypothetical protein